MTTPADDPPAWKIEHKATGHNYLMSRIMSKEAAQIINWKRKQLSSLYYDYEHAKSPEERASKLSEYERQNLELARLGEAVVGHCLGLTLDQINSLPTAECIDLFFAVVDHCAKLGCPDPG